MQSKNEKKVSRRSFMYSMGATGMAVGFGGVGCNNINSTDKKKELIPDFETGERLTDVSCLGMPSIVKELQAANNPYKNPFGTEIALMRTSEGGMSRMAVSWDMYNAHREKGRVYGQKETDDSNPVDLRPALPPDMPAGGHGGSHGHFTCNFIESVLLDKKPLVDISASLNLTISGIVAHESALRDGEWMKIPQY